LIAVLTLAALAGCTSASAGPLEDSLRINYKQASIDEVLMNFGTALDTPIWVDRRVDGEVTWASDGRVPRDELPAALRELLRAHDLELLSEGDRLVVVPSGATRARSPERVRSVERRERLDRQSRRRIRARVRQARKAQRANDGAPSAEPER
jgi:type II secretory pathway component GspD/PulD (secretin)